MIALLLAAILLVPAMASAEFQYNRLTGELVFSVDGLYTDRPYTLAIIAGSDHTKPTLSRSSLIWIDQITTSTGTIEVAFLNMMLPECTILLGGEFRGGDSPLVIGSIENAGYEEAHLPNALVEIDDEAFCQTSINILYLGDKVETIGRNAFSDCTELYIAHIPESVQEIQSGAFSNCPNLTIYCRFGSEIQKYAEENGIPWLNE